MMTTKITPASSYNKMALMAAEGLIREKRHGELSDSHLAQIAAFDESRAEQAARLREAARERSNTVAAAPPEPTSSAAKGARLNFGQFHDLREKFTNYMMGDDESEGDAWLDEVVSHQMEPLPIWLYASTAGAALRAINEKNKQRNKRLDDLEQRLAALESRPQSLKYCGTWRQDDSYAIGDVVTHRGGMWTCLSATRTCPGESASWQLCVKGGRDGRDGKDLR